MRVYSMLSTPQRIEWSPKVGVYWLLRAPIIWPSPKGTMCHLFFCLFKLNKTIGVAKFRPPKRPLALPSQFPGPCWWIVLPTMKNSKLELLRTMGGNWYREWPVNNPLLILTSWVDNESCSLVVRSGSKINNKQRCRGQKKKTAGRRYDIEILRFPVH